MELREQPLKCCDSASLGETLIWTSEIEPVWDWSFISPLGRTSLFVLEGDFSTNTAKNDEKPAPKSGALGKETHTEK
jgi:hypothetical protein